MLEVPDTMGGSMAASFHATEDVLTLEKYEILKNYVDKHQKAKGHLVHHG